MTLATPPSAIVYKTKGTLKMNKQYHLFKEWLIKKLVFGRRTHYIW